MKKTSIVRFGLIMGMFIHSGICVAQTADDAVAASGSTEISVTKEVQGEVGWKSKNKFSVVYMSNEESDQEILFLVDNPVSVVHKKTLDEIAVGDTVRVVFDETVRDTPDGQVTRIHPKEVIFVRSGKTEAESGVLVSE